MGATIETKHDERDKLFTLLSIKGGLIDIDFAIKQQKARMDADDIKAVLDEYARKE